MDGRGGCCIARYSAATAGGGGGGGFGDISYGISKVERIMLKYRPIVPKPMAAGSGSSSTVEHSHGYDGTRRRKRKYVRSNGGKTKKERGKTVSKKRKASPSSSSVSGGGNPVVTLSLMPETPDRKEKSPPTSAPSESRHILSSVPADNPNKPTPIFMISFDNHQHMISTDHLVVTAPPSPRKSQVISVVTVECVTGTWLNSNELGFTDKVMNMEMETCPSFITDNRDTVVWTNKAYKEMTAGGGSDETTVVVVKKVNRVTLPLSHPAFTCRVKVRWGNERDTSPSAMTAPCDVWQLPTGGFAWRLDIKAALSLGWP